MSKFVDIIIARVYNHETIEKMIESSDIPVINALCNTYHPCQAMADIMVLIEVLGNKGTIAYIGDGNNVCNSLIIAAKKFGINIHVSTPADLKPSFEPDLWTENPKKAVNNADAIYTDTWVSMGNESEGKKLINKLSKYQVNKELIGNKYFMHCLPAIRGQEVTDEVIDSEKSLVFHQADNRLHVQKAIILWLLK
jgi:ornithine carbamoyltransferase